MSHDLAPVPLQVGDYVVAPLLPPPRGSRHAAVLARVVQLNHEYRRAAADCSLAPPNPAFLPIDLHAPPPLWLPANPVSPEPPLPVSRGRVYISFVGRDKRLDRWARAGELVRATAAQVNDIKKGPSANSTAKPEVKLTRARRRAKAASNPVSEDHFVQDLAHMELEQLKKVKIKNISKVLISPYFIDAWYYSPFPLPDSAHKLYVCDKCLHYVFTKRDFSQHRSVCTWKTPPGSLLYEDKERHISVYEIDSVVSSRYCQALCLLAKLFLDHKTLFCDVTPFLFYVVTHNGELAGFFSKEHPTIQSEFNVACILTFPPHQKKGIGKFLISLSYELTRREQKAAGPEHPLSDLGQLSYRSYWKYAIVRYLKSRDERSSICAKVSVNEISQATGIRLDDVVLTLKDTNLYSLWKGEHFADASRISIELVEKSIKPGRLPFFPEKLRFSLFASNAPSSPFRPQLLRQSRPKRPKTPKYKKEVTNSVVDSPSIERSSVFGQRSSSINSSGTSASLPEFSKTQTLQLSRFIQYHTPERVFAAMGVCGRSIDLRKYVHDLAEEMKLDYDSVCRRLTKMAAAIVTNKSHSPVSRNMRNGISKTHKSQTGEHSMSRNGKLNRVGCRGIQALPKDFMLLGGRRNGPHAGYTTPREESDVVYIASQSSDD
ncbi:Histone acetyltransferase [Gracilaria domingensis]|nr:Histone acetyltransferase [Gracilaria domingensis]